MYPKYKPELSPNAFRPQIYQIWNFISPRTFYFQKGQVFDIQSQTAGLFCSQNPFHVQGSLWLLASALFSPFQQSFAEC